MAVRYSVLGPGGYPRPPYGDFTTKVPAAGGSKVFTQRFSVLGPGGYPRPPYGSFAAKVAATLATHTNSGVQRLLAYHDGQDAYYREVQRREALQVQQIRLAELQEQRRELEAKRALDEAQRQAAQVRRPSGKGPAPDLDGRIAALVRELAEVTGAVAQTQAEIARLDAIEAHEALLAEQAIDDETILILAATI